MVLAFRILQRPLQGSESQLAKVMKSKQPEQGVAAQEQPSAAEQYFMNQVEQLGSSEFAKQLFGEVWGRPPALDLRAEAALHELLRHLAEDELVVGALDVSDGGLAVALAKGCLQGNVGIDFGATEDVFDERPACVVAVPEESVGAVTKAINSAGGVILGMGVASGENFTVKGKDGVLISAPLSDLRTAHCSTLESQLAAEVVTG